MAGRPRKPEHLKVVKGTHKPSRDNAKRPKTPPVRADELVAPLELSADAKKWYGEVVKHLTNMKVLSAQDVMFVDEMASVYDMMISCKRSLRRAKEEAEMNGETYDLIQKVATKSGGYMLRVRPEATLLNELRRQLHSMMMQCGLTPATRAKVNAQGEGEQMDMFGAYLNGGAR